MNIVVTSGGTREYIDDVRVLTNISSGALGAAIVRNLLEKKQTSELNVYHVRSKHSIESEIIPDRGKLIEIEVESAKDAFRELSELVPVADAVIHAMAVSDFGFNRNGNLKLKSNDPEAFIDYLRQNITVNPKIISHFRDWNPAAKLIGFKFESGKTESEIIDIAYESLQKNRLDMVVANDKSIMQQARSHVAYLVRPDKKVKTLLCRESIVEELSNEVLSTKEMK